MKKISLLFLFLVAFISLGLASCEFGATVVRGIELNEAEITLQIDDEYRISPVLTNLALTDLLVYAKDESVVKVEGFTLKALKQGETEVIIEYKDDQEISVSLLVIVEGEVIVLHPEIKITGDTTVFMRDELILNCELIDLTGDVIWESSNEEVAKVANGVVTALTPGTTFISATVGSYSAGLSITVDAISFTVTFLTRGGNKLKEQVVEYNQAATAPNAPSVQGYVFIGWDKDFSHVTDDLTVQAQYEELPYYNLEFDLDEGTVIGTLPLGGYEGSTIELPTLKKIGYRFDGWVIEGETDLITSITLDQDYKLIAQYTKLDDPAAGYLEVGSGKIYETIGEALASATSGDIILVYPGTYAEEVIISVSDVKLYGLDYDVNPIIEAHTQIAKLTSKLTIASGASNVEIKGLTFNAPTGLTFAGNNKNIKIENNYFDSAFSAAGTSSQGLGQISSSGTVDDLVIIHNSFALKSGNSYNCSVALVSKVTNANISENYFTNTASESNNTFAVWLSNIAGYIQVNKNNFDRFAGNYWTIWLGSSSTAANSIIDVIENILDGKASTTRECGISVNGLTSDTIYVNIIGNELTNVKDTIFAIVGSSTSDTTSKPHVTIKYNKINSTSGRMRFCVNSANFDFGYNFLGEGVTYSDQGTPAISAKNAAHDDFVSASELDIAYENYKNNQQTQYITINYVTNGGTVEGATRIVKGTEYTLPQATKPYATFNGWSLTMDGLNPITKIEKTQEEDVTVYAMWDEEQVFNVTYNFNGGYSEELFMTEVEDAPHFAINNYNYNNGTFWGGRYTTDIFIGNQSNDPKATFSDRFYIAKDQETGIYKVIDFIASGASSWPNGAEYVITISNSYSSYNSKIRPITIQIEVGMYVCFSDDFKTASSTNPVTVGFFKDSPKASTLTKVVTSNGKLATPARLGFRFLGWYDDQDKLYQSVADLTGDVILNARWEELTPVTSIVVEDIPTEMYTEDVAQIRAHVEPSDAYFQQILYSSSNTDILTVSENGLIKALNTGTAEIIMTNYLKTIDVRKTIVVYPINSIDVRSDDLLKGALEVGEEVLLNIQLFGKNASSATYQLSSSDEGVIVADNNGKLTAISEGSANITITSPELNETITLPILVKNHDDEAEGIDAIIQLLIDNHINLIEAGNVSLYNDGTQKVFRSTYGSVNRYLFDEFLVHEDYYSTSENNPNNHKNRRDTDQIEFVCVHDTATLTGTVVSIASGMASGETSIHYTVGNDAIYGVVPEKYIAYHAGDATGTTFRWTKTNAVALDNVKPDYDIQVKDGVAYLTVNGVLTSVQAPNVNGRIPTKADLTSLGPVWKVVDGYYYIGGPLWYSYSQVASRGGNNNSIGIEMCVNLSGDIYDTWQRTAQLVADILLRNNLDPTRTYQHNTYSGKNCPQCLLEGGYWAEFMEMVNLQYAIQKDYSDAKITIHSNNPDILDDTGRIINAPLKTTVVSYDLTVEYHGVTKTVTLSSIVPGTTCWEQWNGTYDASTIWNEKHYVRP